MSQRRCPQIALLVDTATDWGRRMIRGIGRYAQEHGGWDIWLEQRCQHAPGRLPPGWRGDGVIARVADRAMGRYLAGAPGVVVNVSAARIPGVEFPTVTADLRTAARLAVGHLLDQGFRSFGYFAPRGLSYVETHYHSFVDNLAEAGLSCSLFPARRGKGPTATWQRRQTDLRRWLTGLPKPVAVVTWGPAATLPRLPFSSRRRGSSCANRPTRWRSATRTWRGRSPSSASTPRRRSA